MSQVPVVPGSIIRSRPIGVLLIVGGLTFLPALALGPIAEPLAILAGQTF